jgi:hypothetical protein
MLRNQRNRVSNRRRTHPYMNNQNSQSGFNHSFIRHPVNAEAIDFTLSEVTEQHIVCMVVCNPCNGKNWRNIFLEREEKNIDVYDYMMPFRESARHILRKDNFSKEFMDMSTEKLANSIERTVFDLYGIDFVIKQFLDWFRKKSTHNRRRVMIFGFDPIVHKDIIKSFYNEGVDMVYEVASDYEKGEKIDIDIDFDTQSYVFSNDPQFYHALDKVLYEHF